MRQQNPFQAGQTGDKLLYCCYQPSSKYLCEPSVNETSRVGALFEILILVFCCLVTDFSQIDGFAETLTQSLMTDIRKSLRLVIPDYFGFNVVHYDPLKEQAGVTHHTSTPELDGTQSGRFEA